MLAWTDLRACGLGDCYDSCCGRFQAAAPTPIPESLMRSRYSVFATDAAAAALSCIIITTTASSGSSTMATA